MAKKFHQTSFDLALDLLSIIKRSIFNKTGHCPEDYYYIMPVNAYGELVFTLSQTQHLRQQAKVCLLLRNDRNFLLEFWPQAADFVIYLTQEEYDTLFFLEQISFRSPGWFFLCWADLFADGRFGSDLVLKNNRLTLKEAYSYALGLDLSVPILAPQIQNVPAHNADKTVLFVQHAKTYGRIPASFWNVLAQEFHNNGYTIFIDKIAQEDVLLDPEIPVHYLQKTVPELVRFAKSVNLVVALRSGMADLIGASIGDAPMRMITLYHITSKFNRTQKEFHHSAGVAQTGLNLARCFSTDKISDIEIMSDNPEQLINEEVRKVSQLALSK